MLQHLACSCPFPVLLSSCDLIVSPFLRGWVRQGAAPQDASGRAGTPGHAHRVLLELRPCCAPLLLRGEHPVPGWHALPAACKCRLVPPFCYLRADLRPAFYLDVPSWGLGSACMEKGTNGEGHTMGSSTRVGKGMRNLQRLCKLRVQAREFDGLARPPVPLL